MNILNEIRLSKDFLISYLKNPLEQIKSLPNWKWNRVIIVQVAFTAITGAMGGLVAKSTNGLIPGLILTPILTMIMILVSTFFFFYTFQIFLNQSVSFRSLFTTIFFANIPFFILQIASGVVPPINLIGLAGTAMLLVVGFVSNFQLPRKMVMRLIAALYIIFLGVWMYGRFETRADKTFKMDGMKDFPEVHLGE